MTITASDTLYLNPDQSVGVTNIIIGENSTGSNFIVKRLAGDMFRVFNDIVNTKYNTLDNGSGNLSVLGTGSFFNIISTTGITLPRITWNAPTPFTEYVFSGSMTSAQIRNLGSSAITVTDAVSGYGWLVKEFIANFIYVAPAYTYTPTITASSGTIYPRVGNLNYTSGIINKVLTNTFNTTTFIDGIGNEIGGANTLVNAPILIGAIANSTLGNGTINYWVKALLVPLV